MSTSSVLSSTNLDFLDSGSTQAKFTATADTLTFEGTASGTCTLTGVATPTGNSDAATKQYVDTQVGTISPGGADTQIQFNNSSDFGGISTFTTDGTNVSMSGGNINVADGNAVNLGTASDLSLTHDGTNSVVTSTTGNLVLDNTNATGSTIMRLGTDTIATLFQVDNDSGTPLFGVAGSGIVQVTGSTTFSDTTQSTTSTNGAVVVSGGVGIALDVFCSGEMNATAFNATSDATLKRDVSEISSPLDKVMGIPAVQYRYNFIDDDHLRYGVLAQDLEAHGLGHMVTDGADGTKRVDYNNLIGLLIGAVKDLKQEVDSLKRDQ